MAQKQKAFVEQVKRWARGRNIISPELGISSADVFVYLYTRQRDVDVFCWVAARLSRGTRSEGISDLEVDE